MIRCTFIPESDGPAYPWNQHLAAVPAAGDEVTCRERTFIVSGIPKVDNSQGIVTAEINVTDLTHLLS